MTRVQFGRVLPPPCSLPSMRAARALCAQCKALRTTLAGILDDSWGECEQRGVVLDVRREHIKPLVAASGDVSATKGPCWRVRVLMQVVA